MIAPKSPIIGKVLAPSIEIAPSLFLDLSRSIPINNPITIAERKGLISAYITILTLDLKDYYSCKQPIILELGEYLIRKTENSYYIDFVLKKFYKDILFLHC